MKKVKIITVVLAVILVTLVAFAGVYMQTQNRMENKVKDYALSKELDGERIIQIKAHNNAEKSEEEAVTTEENTEENTEETSEQTEENAEKNSDEKTEEENKEVSFEDYKTVKSTIEKRLKQLGAQDYSIAFNGENGTIRIELPENKNTDTYAYYITADSKVNMKEKDTENELLSDSMVKKAGYNYTTNKKNEYQAHLELVLTKEGQAKIEEISNQYAVLKDEIDAIEKAEEEKNKTEETSNEENAEAKTEETAENTEENAETNAEEATENSEENKEETPAKKIAVLSVAGTDYDIERIEKNKVTVKIGGETSNTASANNNISKAAELAMLINSGKYPVEYEVDSNRYIHSDITKQQLLYFSIGALAVLFVLLVIMCIKYKSKGILSAISFIGFVSLFSLLIRYANVMISIEGIGAIILIMLLNLRLNQLILSKTQKMDMVKEAVKSTYKELYERLIPIMIITIVFCFSGWSNLISFGLILFWGIILVAVYNLLVTRTLLIIREDK